MGECKKEIDLLTKGDKWKTNYKTVVINRARCTHTCCYRVLCNKIWVSCVFFFSAVYVELSPKRVTLTPNLCVLTVSSSGIIFA